MTAQIEYGTQVFVLGY